MTLGLCQVGDTSVVHAYSSRFVALKLTYTRGLGFLSRLNQILHSNSLASVPVVRVASCKEMDSEGGESSRRVGHRVHPYRAPRPLPS